MPSTQRPPTGVAAIESEWLQRSGSRTWVRMSLRRYTEDIWNRIVLALYLAEILAETCECRQNMSTKRGADRELKDRAATLKVQQQWLMLSKSARDHRDQEISPQYSAPPALTNCQLNPNAKKAQCWDKHNVRNWVNLGAQSKGHILGQMQRLQPRCDPGSKKWEKPVEEIEENVENGPLRSMLGGSHIVAQKTGSDSKENWADNGAKKSSEAR
ncbi:hypothetical protein K438DRAFT_1770132 [Mycena galopus ATCC 62051]|nr:hypothetical protein K438DRAFT_1770132 [Mycena galopus ATCC 62051]